MFNSHTEETAQIRSLLALPVALLPILPLTAEHSAPGQEAPALHHTPGAPASPDRLYLHSSWLSED